MAGNEVARVVNRCDEAKESNKLDLSRCELTQVPDAIFLLLRSTTLTLCDLSENLLKSVPIKLTRNFGSITELKVDTNHLSSLPNELANMEQLSSLNISHNHFTAVPDVVYRMMNLKVLKAEGNEIRDVEVPMMKELPNLSNVNLKDNPLSQECYQQLMDLFDMEKLNIVLSPQDPEFDTVD